MQETNESNYPTDWNNEAPSFYQLRLFVTGISPISVRAITNIKNICEQYLPNRYELEIIDVHQQPVLVKDEDVTAVPMLIKKAPAPKKRLIGDMSNTERVLRGLGLL